MLPAKYCTDSGSEILEPESYQIVASLTKKFDEGVKAETLNIYKSALSFVMGERVSENPWVRRLMKGIFNLRPIKLGYNKIYNLGPVLRLFEKWYPLENLILSELTHVN